MQEYSLQFCAKVFEITCIIEINVKKANSNKLHRLLKRPLMGGKVAATLEGKVAYYECYTAAASTDTSQAKQ